MLFETSPLLAGEIVADIAAWHSVSNCGVEMASYLHWTSVSGRLHRKGHTWFVSSVLQKLAATGLYARL